MRTTKELLARLLDRRWVAHGPNDSTEDSTKENRKVIYFVFTDKIEAAGQQYRLMADALVDAIEDAHRALVTGPSPDQIGRDPSACTVHFSSKSGAKHAAQFLADLHGYWAGHLSGAANIEAYHLRDKSIRSKIDDACFFHDPNGLLDFSFINEPVDKVVTIDKDRHQLAKRYLDVLSRISDHGIVPDWPYDKDDCELIWKTHQAKATLTRLILSSCSDKKPHPDIQKSYQVITFKPDGEDFDILMDGQPLLKFTSAARRAALALALQPNLGAIKMEDFCNACDPAWAIDKSRSKNIPKKFSQAIQSLHRIVPEVHHDTLGAGRARVYGIKFEGKPSPAKLKKQISNLERITRD